MLLLYLYSKVSVSAQKQATKAHRLNILNQEKNSCKTPHSETGQFLPPKAPRD